MLKLSPILIKVLTSNAAKSLCTALYTIPENGINNKHTIDAYTINAFHYPTGIDTIFYFYKNMDSRISMDFRLKVTLDHGEVFKFSSDLLQLRLQYVLG